MTSPKSSASVTVPGADCYTISEACVEVDMLHRVIAENERELDRYARDADAAAALIGDLLNERDALITQLERAKAAAKRKSWRGW